MSEAGETCRLRNPFAGQPAALAEGEGQEQRLTGDWLEFKTAIGKKYLLTAAGAPQKPPMRPPPRAMTAETSNWFGKKAIARF